MSSILPPVTRVIIIINVLVFLAQQVAGTLIANLFALWPLSDSQFQPWQLLTYAFLHEGDLARFQITHIFFNMFALFMFGSPLERLWGSRRYLLYYVACILSAAAIELLAENATSNGAVVIGASGGVFGLLLAFGWYFPKEKMVMLLLPIPMPAWLFVTLYGIAELYLGVTGTQPDVAHFAHLGGMLGGALAILYWRVRGRFAP
jgi:membrane associated rhomboid family serine protease